MREEAIYTNAHRLVLTSMSPMQVWRRSKNPCAVQGGADLPTWNAHAGQRETYLSTRNTAIGK